MLVHNFVDIVDIKEYKIAKKDRDMLLETFMSLMGETSSLVKRVEFDIDEFYWPGRIIKGYTLVMERLLKEKKLEQWQATFSRKGKVKMVTIGQVGL